MRTNTILGAMVAAAKSKIAAQEGWMKERRGRIDGALAALDADFRKVLGMTAK